MYIEKCYKYSLSNTLSFFLILFFFFFLVHLSNTLSNTLLLGQLAQYECTNNEVVSHIFWIKIFLVYGLPFNNRTNLSAASQLIFSMWLMHELRRCRYPCFIDGHSMILLAEWNIYRLTIKCWYWSVFERNYLVASVYLPWQINAVGFLATSIPKKYYFQWSRSANKCWWSV